jgi:hypothetical protein
VQIAKWVYQQTELAKGQVWVMEKVLKHLSPAWSQCFRLCCLSPSPSQPIPHARDEPGEESALIGQAAASRPKRCRILWPCAGRCARMPRKCCNDDGNRHRLTGAGWADRPGQLKEDIWRLLGSSNDRDSIRYSCRNQ